MRIKRIVIPAILFLTVFRFVGAAFAADDNYIQGMQAFQDGRFDDASNFLRKCVESPSLSKEERVSVHRTLGFCALVTDRAETAKSHFKEALILDSSFDPTGDPVWGKKSAEAYYSAKVEYMKEAQLQPPSPKPEPTPTPAPPAKSAQKPQPPGSDSRSAYRTAGWILTGAGVAGAVAGVVFWQQALDWSKKARNVDEDQDNSTERENTVMYQNYEIVSFSAAGVFSVGAIICLWKGYSEPPSRAETWKQPSVAFGVGRDRGSVLVMWAW